MPLRGSKLAYYLKKRDPELYERARDVKERYNLPWDEAIAIARGERPPPGDLESRVKLLEDEVRRLREELDRHEEIQAERFESPMVFMLLALHEHRFKDDMRCVYLDDEGYCTQLLHTSKPIFEDGVKEVYVDGRKYYIVQVCNPEEGYFPDELTGWLCAFCPNYRPRARLNQP